MICYGKEDDLVDREAALAPLEFIKAEVTGFPKGHGAIATSWSNPQSAFALQKRFEDGSRGPVGFNWTWKKKKNNRLPAEDSLMGPTIPGILGKLSSLCCQRPETTRRRHPLDPRGIQRCRRIDRTVQKILRPRRAESGRPGKQCCLERAAADFKKSFGDYFSIMGWVSKDETCGTFYVFMRYYRSRQILDLAQCPRPAGLND